MSLSVSTKSYHLVNTSWRVVFWKLTDHSSILLLFAVGLSDPDAGEEDFTLAGEGEHRRKGSSGEEGL